MIKNNQSLDFEDIERYTMEVEAKDGGGLSSQCKVIIDILDENDNIPEIIITSLSDQILEVLYQEWLLPFSKHRTGILEETVKSPVMSEEMFLSRFLLLPVVLQAGDRWGSRPESRLRNTTSPSQPLTGASLLSSSTTITLHITDINDNAPVFHQAS